jgi:MFS family permease
VALTDDLAEPDRALAPAEAIEAIEAEVYEPELESRALRLGLAEVFASLRHRNFRIFMTGAIISNAGTWMQNVALGYLMVVLTHSAFWVGMVAFAQFFPLALLGLFAGAVSDRFDRRWILIWGQGVAMVLAFVLAGVTASGHANRGSILGIVALSGVAAAFYIPAWQTMVADLVPRERMFNAITLNSAQFHLARVLGPLLAALVVRRFGLTTAFMLNGISYLTVLWALLVVRPVRPQQIATERPLERVRGGIRFARRHPGVRRALLTMACISLFGIPIIQLMPAVAASLGSGAGGLGVLLACLGGGAVLGAVLLPLVERRLTRSQMVALGMPGLGALLVTVGVSGRLWLAAVMLVPLGACYIACVSLLNTSVQMLTPDSFRGRAMSIFVLTFGGLLPIGSLALGRAADAIHNVGHALAFGGLVVMAYSLATGLGHRFDALNGRAEASDEPAARAT